MKKILNKQVIMLEEVSLEEINILEDSVAPIEFTGFIWNPSMCNLT